MSALNSILRRSIRRWLPYQLYSPILQKYRHLTAVRYKGGALECPFCAQSFSKFLPNGMDFPVLTEKNVIGGGFRSQALCPRCRCGDRERAILLYLQREQPFTFQRKIKMLHIAPEKCLSRHFRSLPNVDYLSADLDSPVADIKMDITAIQFADETFDIIICSHVLEHIPNDLQAMRELCRVLKRGGISILQVPISFTIPSTIEDPTAVTEEQKIEAFGQKDHVRIYGPDYVNRLSDSGFTVNPVQLPDYLSVSEIAKFSLVKEERLFVCSRET